jgi:hypothetical protein
MFRTPLLEEPLVTGPDPMKRRQIVIGLAIVLLAGCSDSKPQPTSPGPDARSRGDDADAGRGGTGGGAAGTDGPAGGSGGPGADAGGGVDAPAGGPTEARPDVVADRADGGGVADAPVATSDSSPADLRRTSDASSSDGRFRYPDPAGELCGNSRHTLAKSPAEVLDRSNSMQEFTVAPATKWDDATDAVEAVMAVNPSVAWGLKLFPTGVGECALGPDVEVPVRFAGAAFVAAAMDAAGPPLGMLGDGTPTDQAINVAAGYLKTVTSALPKYIVLVTDGIPSCSDQDPDTTIQAIADAAAAGFPTFVIGIGDEDGSDLEALDEMAVAGGKPRAAMPRFYPAANRAELDAVLEAIAVSITTCVFPLAARPLDPEYVGVTVDSALVPRDPSHQQGWDYTTNGMAVEIFGSVCTDLKNGTATSVGVHFGCPN